MQKVPLAQRLRDARARSGLEQARAALALGVDRVNLSYWENGKRVPGLGQLRTLADLYGVGMGYLMGEEDKHEINLVLSEFVKALGPEEGQVREKVQGWLSFLEEWADLLAESGELLPGRGKPPVSEWRGDKPLTDSRRAKGLALEVRKEYHLGLDSIPDLLAFLDYCGVLVHRAALGRDSRITGVFYNSDKLGYCVLLNVDKTLGRQNFTLAHEFAHALFHSQETRLVSRDGAMSALETFADRFAGHFLVPSETLAHLVHQTGLESAYDVVRLQPYFRSSYATLMYRLREDRHLDAARYEEYKSYSPNKLAARMGLDVREFQDPSPLHDPLSTHPVSVLDTLTSLIRQEHLTPPSAASLLRVPLESVLKLLKAPPQAEAEEQREFDELPAFKVSKKPSKSEMSL